MNMAVDRFLSHSANAIKISKYFNVIKVFLFGFVFNIWVVIVPKSQHYISIIVQFDKKIIFMNKI